MNSTLSKFIYGLLLLLSTSIWAQNSAISAKSARNFLKKAGASFLALDTKRSLYHAKQALEVAVPNKDFVVVAKAYNLIGLNFDEFSEHQKAIDFYKKGLLAADKTSNDTVKGWLHNNLGNVYCYKKIDFNKGIEQYKQGLLISEKLKNQYEIVFTKLNIGSAYFSIQDFKSGIKYFKDVKASIDADDNIEAKITLYSNLGLYYSYLNNLQEAERNYVTALNFSQKNTSVLIKSNVAVLFKDISNFYYKFNNFEKAHYYLLQYNLLKDDLYNEERVKNVKEEGSKIEFNEFNRKIQLIEAEKQIQNEKLVRNKQVLVLLSLLIVVLVLLFLANFKNNKLKAKANSDLKVANEALQKAKVEAEEASKVKSQFISTISHELRTPLYGVVGITDFLEEEHQELKNSQHLKSLKFSAQYLLALVNDILKIYKIEEGQLEIKENCFHLEDEIATVVDSLQFLAIKNNNHLVFEHDKTLPNLIFGDKLRLSQIIINLLTNSLKFTKNGNVVLRTKNMEHSSQFCKIKFDVIDNGIGIAVEDQERVFDKFVQISRSESDYQGTGLGLSIVKKMVALFNGTIELFSEENKGTTISFIITFKVCEEKNKIERPLQQLFDKEFRILVVEDNKINQIITKKFLDNSKAASVIVDDGFKALELVDKETFDVILMDINMPLINGFETAKRMRTKGVLTPIIATTAFDKNEIVAKTEEAEINDVLVKPFTSEALFQAIYNQLKK